MAAASADHSPRFSEAVPSVEPRREPYRRWEDLYRQQWRWDRVAWASHCVDCYPGNCPFRVYVKDGTVLREEQAGTYDTVEPGVPDMNPMGCQKGVAWVQMLYGQERVLYPLKRAGSRGEGKWKRISWDEALTEIADAIIDAIQEGGPEAIFHETTPAQGGLLAVVACGRLFNLLGGIALDLEGVINDFNVGMYLTYGKFNVSSVDDWFHSDLILIWHMNPVYTRIPYYHYVAEARYKGAEVVTIAPDFSPSAVHADAYVPVKPGSDAALALGMCQVVVEEGLYDRRFVQEQTDLPLLVRSDSGRFLRASDLRPEGRDDQFYFFDAGSARMAEAPRGTLALGGVDPALEGAYKTRLADGREVEVRPVFAVLREKLGDYTPERASEHCGTGPEVIRSLARKVASGRTNILMGFNSCKYYHGDLMERSMCLLLALTGNWGRKGTGPRSWSTGPFDGPILFGAKQRPGPEGAREVLAARHRLIEDIKAQDPTMTDEMAAIEMAQNIVTYERVAPAFFFLHHHWGYRDNWNNRQWGDPTAARSFDEYMQEALDRGWWEGLTWPQAGTYPSVFIETGGNLLRRARGGQEMLLRYLWPRLKMVVTIDWRMTTTGLYSDIFLPAATHFEKINFHYTTPHVMQLLLTEQAAAPAGEAKSEWEVFRLLARRIEERARERGFVEYRDRRGRQRRLDRLHDAFTLGGEFMEAERVCEEWVADTAIAGALPSGTTLDTLREKGFVRFVNWGISPFSLAQASDIRPNETHCSMRWHTEKKLPYPTLTRRAQFYFDHDWFLEGGEELPVHKETPTMGGDYPLTLTSGHMRWSIHAANVANRLMLQIHRGHPFLFMSPDDAAARGIADDEEVRVYNDMSSFHVRVKLAPSVRPGQVIIYNGWEPFMFRGWRDTSNVEPGMVKWLHLAGGYGQVRYRPGCWQPVTVDRALRVEVSKTQA
jgi:DMSO reductase family type II enzyme molybdopterin subunit